jgi:putative restriction endonuclease
LTSSNSIRSFKALTDALDYALIDVELAELLKERTNRDILSQAILSEYFPGNKVSAVEEIKGDYLKDIQTKLFNEPNPEFIERVKDLYGNSNIENEELELKTYSSGEAFKREIPKIYNYNCAITCMRIDSASDVSMVDACHIVPFRISFDDSLINGIALCPNMHRAFDPGLIAIDEEYRVVVSKNFMEAYSHDSIQQYV